MLNHSRGESLRPFLSWILIALVVLPGSPLAAQTAAPPKPQLRILTVEGENASTPVGQRAPHQIVVQVQDEKGQPVSGVSVQFALPDSGPSGTFANGTRTLLARTDRDGRAVIQGLRANGIEGQYQILVEATLLEASAKSSIRQVNAPPVVRARSSRKVSRLLLIAGIAGAAAAMAVIIGARSSDSDSTPITITPGTPSVGGR